MKRESKENPDQPAFKELQENLVPLGNPPGSRAWMRWFQSRQGDVPQNSGSIALDYEMVTSQAYTNYQAATGSQEGIEALELKLQNLRRRGSYTSE